ncbi:hypothetical protein AAHN97_06425 [Chitinophaga niabensis]|uniref:hypothetical protein n=1 Tax=Chitinophaga niabensis TaxID=536979 RepID=UPI0031BBCD22
MDNIKCRKSEDGFITHPKKEARATTKDQTRENMQEFARALSGATIIRNTFSEFIEAIDVSYFGHRLNSQMTKVVKSDVTNPRGYRNLYDGELHLLKGFQLNSEKRFSDALKGAFSASIDRATGLMKVVFPSLVKIIKPEEASYFRLYLSGASIDFQTAARQVVYKSGEYMLIRNEGHILSPLEVQLPAACTSTLILALGICFYKEVDGRFSPIGKGYNAAAFVAVSAQ